MGLAVAKHIGFDVLGAGRAGLGVGVAEGRLASAWVQGGVRGGILCLTVYLWHTEGMSVRNVEILAQAGEIIRQHRGPWLVGGDFNLPPDAFQKKAGWWLEKVGGSIQASGETTFRPAQGTHSELDYFVIDGNIAHTVARTEVVLSLDLKPHRGVRLVLKPLGANTLVSVLRKPRAFPRERPVGCARLPAVPYALAEEPRKVVDLGEDRGEGLEKMWEGLVNCVEIELCGMCDAFKEGRPDARYMGRAGGARAVKERSLPQRSAGEKGKLDITTYGYAWTATRVRELMWLGRSAGEAGECWPEAARRQWHGLMGRFRRPGPMLRPMMAED